MMSSKITHKITQGMYVLTTTGGGCIVDAVSRVGSSGDQALIAVAVAKANHSNQLLRKCSKFALSVLAENADPEIIEVFGFNSSKDLDKCTKCKTEEVAGIPVVKKSLGYMILEKVDAIENETHTVFIGKIVEGEVLDNEARPMTYAYYQEHKDDLVKKKTTEGKTAWVCTACGYIYYGDEVPDDFKCPLCGLGKAYFKKQEG